MFGRFSKILVVDDSAVQRRIICQLLAALGFDNVETAPNGRAALAMLEVHTYRLVVSDWEMEPMNGPALLRAMRADSRWKRLPFIMTTVQAQVKFSAIARDDGVTCYLPKPFTADMLAERIATIGDLSLARV